MAAALVCPVRGSLTTSRCLTDTNTAPHWATPTSPPLASHGRSAAAAPSLAGIAPGRRLLVTTPCAPNAGEASMAGRKPSDGPYAWTINTTELVSPTGPALNVEDVGAMPDSGGEGAADEADIDPAVLAAAAASPGLAAAWRTAGEGSASTSWPASPSSSDEEERWAQERPGPERQKLDRDRDPHVATVAGQGPVAAGRTAGGEPTASASWPASPSSSDEEGRGAEERSVPARSKPTACINMLINIPVD